MEKSRIAIIMLCSMLLLSACEASDEGATTIETVSVQQNESAIDKENDMEKGSMLDVLKVQSLGEEIELSSVDGKTVVIKKEELDAYISDHTLEIGDYVSVHFNEYSLNEDGTYSIIDLVYASYVEKDITKYKDF